MSDLWTEDEIEDRILGTLPMPVHHAMNLRECLYQIQARDERIRELTTLVESAYREGFWDGYDDDARPQDADAGWEHSDVRKRLEQAR